MLTLASLLAAMTIAGAFWVGILAARRLRDWGDGRRQLLGAGTRLCTRSPLVIEIQPRGRTLVTRGRAARRS